MIIQGQQTKAVEHRKEGIQQQEIPKVVAYAVGIKSCFEHSSEQIETMPV